MASNILLVLDCLGVAFPHFMIFRIFGIHKHNLGFHVIDGWLRACPLDHYVFEFWRFFNLARSQWNGHVYVRHKIIGAQYKIFAFIPDFSRHYFNRRFWRFFLFLFTYTNTLFCRGRLEGGSSSVCLFDLFHLCTILRYQQFTCR